MFAALVVACAASPLAAPGYLMQQVQPRCFARSEVVKFIANKYGEFVVADGLTNIGAMMEVFATPDGATWTMMLSFPNGMTCFVAAGERWEMKVKRPGQPKDRARKLRR